MNGETHIGLSRVSKSYASRKVLDIESLTIDKGEICALTGSNGSGKTTLLRLIAGLETPDTGRIDRGVPAGRIGFCLQKPYMFRGTVRDNIIWGMTNRSTASDAAAIAVARRLGIDSLLGLRAKKLSSGETQKVSFARALVRNPLLLLLDEPAANLDAAGVDILENEIRRHIRDGGSCIVATHMHDHALRLSARIVRLERGTGIDIEEAINVFDGTAETEGDGAFIAVTDTLRIACAPPHPVRGTVRFAITASEIVLAATPIQSSMRNCFPGTVVSLASRAGAVEAVVDIGIPLRVLITSGSRDYLGLSPGTPVYAAFKATSVRIVKGCV